MFNLAIWCHQKERRQQILTCVQKFEQFTVIEDTKNCDILLIDIMEEAYSINTIYPILKQREDLIIVMMAKEASMLLDIVGLSIYQYILYEQLELKLVPCLQAIQEYLVNISTLCIRVNRENINVKIQEIRYVRYMDSFVYIGLEHKELPTQYTSLERVKAQVGEDFMFCNRNTMVHIPYITSIKAQEICLKEHTFSLSRRRKSALMKRCAKERWQK